MESCEPEDCIRDRLRRRLHLAHQRAERLAHVQQTNSPDTLPVMGQEIASKANRDGVAERFVDPAGQTSREVELTRIGHDMVATHRHRCIMRHFS